MRKRRVTGLPAVALVAAASLLLSGCGDSVTVDNDQNDLIAEYVAGTLMKYSYTNEWKTRKLAANITNFEHVENTAVPAVSQDDSATKGSTASTSGTGGSSQTTSSGTLSDLASAFGMDGITISYKGSELGKRYPDDEDVLSVRATSGKEIVTVRFNLANNGTEPVTCNTAQLSVVLKLAVNGNGNVTEYATMLKNDINSLSNVTISPGENYEAVALFMVSEGLYDSIDSLTLTVGGQGVSGAKIALN
jgi:uncharacterized protein YceK